MNEKRIPALDGWRALAALGVVFSHASYVWPHSIVHGASYIMGPVCVKVFFAISGFLITSLLLQESARSGTISLSKFYVRRAFRILPLIVCYLAVIVVLQAYGNVQSDPRGVAASILFYRNYLHNFDGAFWTTSHFWSLSVEEHFYALWPVALWLALRSGKNPAFIAGAAILCIAVWRAEEFYQGPALFPQAHLWFRSDIIGDFLLWGALFAVLQRGSKFMRRGWFLAIALMLAAAGTGMDLLARGVSTAGSVTLQAIGYASLVGSTALQRHSWITRALDFAPLRYIGAISYSLYIWQQLFVGPNRTDHILLRVAAVFCCAIVSYYVVEQPARSVGRMVIARPMPALPVPAARV